MVGLVSGYGSSDDESPQPVASSSKKTLPTLSSGPTDDAEIDGDDSDDDALEQSATTDAFGLAKKRSNGTARPVQTDTAVAAAPDVLKEDVNGISSAIITRPTDQVMNVNITYADMQRPVAGPEDPFNQRKNKGMNSLAGTFLFNIWAVLLPSGAILTCRTCGGACHGPLHIRHATTHI